MGTKGAPIEIEMVCGNWLSPFGKPIGDDLLWQLRDFCSKFEVDKCHLSVTRWAIDRLTEAYMADEWILRPLEPGESPEMSFNGFRIEVRDD